MGASALEQLRKVNEVNGSARSEAEGVARLIREALGEPILVPVAASASVPDPVRQAVKPAGRGNTVRAAAMRGGAAPPSAGAVTPARLPATTATSGRNNPFGALQ